MSRDSNDLLGRFKNRSKNTGAGLSKAPEGAAIPLTAGQKRLWFYQQAHPESAAYNYGIRYFGKGSFDLDRFRQAWEALAKEYTILRSYYPLVNNKPEIKITEELPSLVYKDLSQEEQAEALAEKEEHSLLHRLYDLSQAHLCSFLILKTEADTYRFTFATHHILVDEWSVGGLIQKLADYYTKGFNTDQEVLDFRDVAWSFQQKEEGRHLPYWTDYIRGAQAGSGLVPDFQMGSGPTGKGARWGFSLPAQLSVDSKKQAQELGLTLFEWCFGLFGLHLHQLGGNTDFIIASPATLRQDMALQKQWGYLIETVLYRFQFDQNKTLKNLLSELSSDHRKAQSKLPLPLESLVSEHQGSRDLSKNPLFETMFVYNESQDTPPLGEDFVWSAEESSALETSKFDLTLFSRWENEQLHFSWEYNPALFSEESIQLMAQGFLRLFEAVAENGVEQLAYTYRTQEPEIPEASWQNPWSGLSSIPERFKQMVEQYPEKTALSFGTEQWTYKTLDQKSTEWALALLQLNPQQKPIALHLDRSLEQIAALMAVLKSGVPYLALDPEYPAGRLNYMLENSGCSLVLSTDKDKFRDTAARVIDLPHLEEVALEEQSTSLPSIKGEQPAYIIYTSGSSGKPKGVVISHSNLLYSTAARLAFYPDQPGVFYWTSSLSFDSSKAGLYWTLLQGGHLRIAPTRSEQDMEQMAKEIESHQVSHLLTLPSLYKKLLQLAPKNTLSSLTTAMVAGESCEIEVIETHYRRLEHCKLYNEYGPSEGTVWATAKELLPLQDAGRVSIGKAIPGTQVYVLDRYGQLASPLQIGELCISGPGLAEGYLHTPELTAEKFKPNPWGKGNFKSLYRTGDQARWNSQGELEFFGRKDQQLKIRGQRVELEEIQSALANLLGIDEACVVVHQLSTTPLLVAYYTADQENREAEIRESLQNQLPSHMVPKHLLQLEKFPLLPNGKVDRQKLSLRPLEIQETEGSLPTSELQQQLAVLFEEVSEKRPVYIEDNYFDLGGDSIKSIELIAKARNLGMNITPNILFKYPTIQGLSQYLEAEQEEAWDYLVKFHDQGTQRPLFCIHAGGGHVFFYKELHKFIENRPVYALQPSGAYDDQELQPTINAMALDYIQSMKKVQAEGPYTVLVYCFSAVVGNEICRLLRADGQQVDLIVVDTMTSPANLNSPKRLKMRVQAFGSRLLRSPKRTLYYWTIARYSLLRMRFQEKAAKEEEARKLERLRRHLMQLSQGHPFSEMEEDVYLLLTKKDHRAVNRETVASWKRTTSGEVRVLRVPGEHMTLFDDGFLETTSKAIQESLNQIEKATEA